ncbi:MAG TPA: efflux transporter outer membrane subunit [Bryobacteraceae bacterium]|jgi:NodT family efflux transporter outer membrane factor (OMF) lipoprotein
MNRSLSAALACALLSLPACTLTPVGPKYTRPDIPAPPFKEELPPEEGWKVSAPSDDAHRGNWWEVYADPQLNALEEQVLVNNQTIRAAAANYRSAVAAVQLARASLFPNVTGGASTTGIQQSQNRLGGSFVNPGPFADITPSGSASWEADVWGRIRNNIEVNVAGAQASAADLENALLSVRAEVASYYFQIQGLDAQKNLLDNSVTAYQRAVELTGNRFREGLVSAVDVAQAQTQLESARAQSTDTEVLRAQYEHAIAVLLGKAPSELSIPAKPLMREPPPTPPGLASELLERRPDIAAAERRVAAANAQIGVARAAFYPTVMLAASFGLETSNLGNLLTWPSRFWTVGPTLAQTLWEGGRRRAFNDEAQAAYDANAANYRQTVLSAFQEVEDDVSTLRLLDRESQEQARAATGAQRALDLANSRYQGGITTYLEVITAQTTALETQRTAAQLLTRRMAASVDLVKALGGGWNATTDLPTPQSLRSAR